MNIYILLLLSLAASTKSLDSKSINLDMRTSIIFDPKDIRNNKTVILDVKKFLEKIGNLFKTDSNIDEERHFEFSDFLHNMADTIMKYDDEALRSLKDAVYYGINSVKGRKSGNLFADDNLNTGFIKILNKYNDKEPNEIRKDIKRLLEGDNDKVLVDFTTHLNNYFNIEDGKHLYEIFRIFSATRNKELLRNLAGIAIDYVFYNFYNNLSDTSKMNLFHELGKIGRHLSSGIKDGTKEKRLENMELDKKDVTQKDNSLEKLIQLIASKS